jgi:hypothetical protein
MAATLNTAEPMIVPLPMSAVEASCRARAYTRKEKADVNSLMVYPDNYRVPTDKSF